MLRNRSTNLNARMFCGTTPLILAARLAIEGMVEDLINAEADIEATDNKGESCHHASSHLVILRCKYPMLFYQKQYHQTHPSIKLP